MMEVKERDAVAVEDTWNVEALYASLEAWEQDFRSLAGSPENTHRWPELAAFQGRLAEGASVLRELLDSSLELARRIEKLYVYAHLRHDENTTNDAAKKAYQQALNLYHQFGQEISWIEPELLGLKQELLDSYLVAPQLEPYAFHLEKIVRMKRYTLSPGEEKILAYAAQPLTTASQAFSAMNNADLDFGEVMNGKQERLPLSHGNYSVYLHSQDRTLRKNAFQQMLGTYKDFENTLANLISGVTQSHYFNARSRGYSSCLEAALYPKNIDTQVYHSLINTVRKNAPTLHRYAALRKRLLGVEELHLYDMYVPVTADFDMQLDYDEAQKVVIESAAPLGEEYQSILRKGLEEQRWVDRYENKNKRSGGYSSGCYDSMPYILMNYKGVMRDVFTLCHEGGHSMHSELSRKNQPYHYSSYTIFVAEVASTFNEALLHNYLMERAGSKEQQIFLVNNRIEDIRATLFRQTMFAEFELRLHEWTEQGIPLTPDFLKKEYRELNAAYFGPDVVIDDEIAIEWARIPHFYYNFYVYQYATGVSAALALASKVTEGGSKEREAYLSFLKGGSSAYSLDLLEKAGVDMRQSAPVEAAIKHFDELVSQLDALTS